VKEEAKKDSTSKTETTIKSETIAKNEIKQETSSKPTKPEVKPEERRVGPIPKEFYIKEEKPTTEKKKEEPQGKVENKPVETKESALISTVNDTSPTQDKDRETKIVKKGSPSVYLKWLFSIGVLFGGFVFYKKFIQK